MKSIFLFFCIITHAVFSFSQNVTVGAGEKPLLKSVARTFTEGSAYFNNAPANGKIKTDSRKEFTINNLRYNLETQQLEYAENDHVYTVQDAVQSFTLPDSVGNTHVFTKLDTDGPAGFYETLVDGRISLLKQYAVKKEVTEDWYTKKKSSKMVKQDIYFTKKEGIIQKLSLSAKNVATVLADKKNDVTAFIKDEQLDLKQGDDLVKIFKYYNALK